MKKHSPEIFLQRENEEIFFFLLEAAERQLAEIQASHSFEFGLSAAGPSADAGGPSADGLSDFSSDLNEEFVVGEQTKDVSFSEFCTLLRYHGASLLSRS